MKRTGSDLENECNLKAESDVVTLLLRVKVRIFAYFSDRYVLYTRIFVLFTL